MINQFGINLGYMLMPYLAGYLAGPLGLAAWAVGLVLGSATSPSRACSSSAARWPTGWAKTAHRRGLSVAHGGIRAAGDRPSRCPWC